MRFSNRISVVVLTSVITGILGCSDNSIDSTAGSTTDPATVATLFHNGQFITMDDAMPSASALAVSDGRIVAVGDEQSVRGANLIFEREVDLQGKTVLPGFIDAHGHFSLSSNYIDYANVASPPVGPARSIADIIEILRAEGAEGEENQWIIGYGYDESLLLERRHPTRDDLDQVSTEQPVLINHVSGHLVSCNSKCLQLLEVDETTPDPSGGHIQRYPDSQVPNGVLEESARYPAIQLVPSPNEQQRQELISDTQAMYASYGITTISDAAILPAELQALELANSQEALYLDIVAYVPWVLVPAMIDDSTMMGEYQNRLKLAGVKVILDGSPQAKTAWLSEPYHVIPSGQEAGYAGYPSMTNETLRGYLRDYFAKGWQVKAHANGDAAAQQLIDVVDEVTREFGKADRRTVMIHAQTVREDQLDRMGDLDIMPSFFVAHTFFWGDWHRDSVLGPDRARRISPLASTAARGIPYTIHNDTPVVPANITASLWSAVNRLTRSGEVLGPEQSVSVMDALRAVTITAAYQFFEEEHKGSLSSGKLADLVVLSDSPLEINPALLNQITVLATYKEGKLVYSAQ